MVLLIEVIKQLTTCMSNLKNLNVKNLTKDKSVMTSCCLFYVQLCHCHVVSCLDDKLNVGVPSLVSYTVTTSSFHYLKKLSLTI